MKIVLITGGASGLGYELAKVYASNHYCVFLIGRNQNKLSTAVEAIRKNGFQAEYFVCDITDRQALQVLKDHLTLQFKTIDCLINNAGIGFFGAFEDLSSFEMDQMLEINVKGTIQITQSLLPIINENIINIISTAGLKGKTNEAVYVSSKFAIRGFTESLKQEYADSKLSITAVYMGGMDTPFWNNSNHIKDKSRLKNPADVAQMIFDNRASKNDIIL